jgi:predicted nucleotidyltransferase
VRAQAAYADGRWNGKTLSDWVPDIVADIVRGFDPRRVILFGSVARGQETPDSDLDVLVVLDELDPTKRAELMGEIRFAISSPAPIDVFVTDPQEFERRGDVIGSIHYWASREGRVVYERPV